MGFKQSRYNIKIEELTNDNILIFNSYSRAFGIMDKKCRSLYENITEIDEKLLTNQKDIDNFKSMKNNNFIINDTIDELKLIKIQEQIGKFKDSKVFSLTIAPTLNCNMACPYCYEKKTNTRMSDEVMKDLLGFIEKQLENKEYFFITWYGGEPLLEKQRIYDISKEVLKICKKKGINYNADIITNGVLLDYNTAKILKENCNINSAQITLDGYGEENNKRRLLKNGGDSFKIITDNIDKAKDFLQISIRINVDKTNINSALKLLKFFNEKRWTGEKNVFPYVAPIYSLDDRNNANKSICYSTKEFLSINSSILEKLFKNKMIPNIEMLIPPRRSVSCSAICLENSYVVDSYGMLYSCWDLVGMKKHNIGNVKDGPKMNAEKIKWLSINIPNDCNNCKLLPLCMGGCPSIRIINSTSKACSHRILNYKKILKMFYKNYKNTKRTEEKTKIS